MGEPSAGPDPGPPTLQLGSWHPPSSGTGGEGPPPTPLAAPQPRARQGAPPRGGRQQRRLGDANLRRWTPASSRGGSGRRPTLGAARRARPRQTGKPSGLAQPSVPHPRGRQLTIFLPAVTFPRAPLRMAPRPPPFLPRRPAEPPPPTEAVWGRHVTADGGRRGSKLAGRGRR